MLKEIEEGTIGAGNEEGTNDDPRLLGDQQRQTARDRNNLLLKKVKHTRELKLDAEIFHARTKMTMRHLEACIKVSPVVSTRLMRLPPR